MMLAHAAWTPAGAARVDEAGEILALEGRRGADAGDIGRLARDQRLPVVELDRARLADADRLHADEGARMGRAEHGGHQRPRELVGRDDHHRRTRILKDMLVIALGVGGVGGDSDAARGHDCEVGDAPFGAVLGDEHHPVAGLEPDALKRARERCNLPRRLRPAHRLPGACLLGPEKGLLTLLRGAREEHADEIIEVLELPRCVRQSYPHMFGLSLSKPSLLSATQNRKGGLRQSRIRGQSERRTVTPPAPRLRCEGPPRRASRLGSIRRR